MCKRRVQCKREIAKVVSAQKGMWVRIADPQRSEVHLRQESKEALQWLFACFAHDRQRPLRQKPMLHCFAAADARADGDTVGVGGWIVASTQCAWFAVQWQASELRTVWPHLSDAPQRYIACFEVLIVVSSIWERFCLYETSAARVRQKCNCNLC